MRHAGDDGAVFARIFLPARDGGRSAYCAGIDHLDRQFRAVRRHPAQVQGRDRDRCARGGGGHGPGAADRPERRCRRCPGARPRRRGRVRHGRLVAKTPRRHVQRLRHCRAGVRPGQGRRQGFRPGIEPDRQKPAAVRVARRQQRHAQQGTGAVEGSGHRRHGRVGHVVPRNRQRHGSDAQHGGRHERLCPDGPRHMGFVQEPGRAQDPG